MYRIYLDWNVISNLKRDSFKDLKGFIDQNKSSLLFPYSPAHFSDLMKSYAPDNQYFEQDLDMLEYLCDKHLLQHDAKKTEYLFCTPKEYFKRLPKEEDDILDLMNFEKMFDELDETSAELGLEGIGKLYKSFLQLTPTGIDLSKDTTGIFNKMFPSLSSKSSMWDIMKDIAPFAKNLMTDRDFYKDFRKSVGDGGFKIGTNSGNWNEEDVIKNIDAYLKQHSPDLTFMELIKTTQKHQKKNATRYDIFTFAYCMLDMMGYKPDKLPKLTDTYKNIQLDGDHAFYAAHCDYFIVGDKKLRIKAKVLFSKFNIATKVLSPEEALGVLEQAIFYPEHQLVDTIIQAIQFIKAGEEIESFTTDFENGPTQSDVRALNVSYFDFFNQGAISTFKGGKDGWMLFFEKAVDNYGSCFFYTELETLAEKISQVFGFNSKEELDEHKHEFAYNPEGFEFIWEFPPNYTLVLKRDSKSNMPIFYIIMTPDDNGDAGMTSSLSESDDPPKEKMAMTA